MYEHRFAELLFVGTLTTAVAEVESWVINETAYDAELVAAITAGVPLPLAVDVPTTASGCPARYPTSETERTSEFTRIHSTWPPRTDSIAAAAAAEPDRAAAWSAYMAQKEDAVARIEDTQWRWERWLELVQIRTLPTFTKTGWGIGDMPADVHAAVLAHVRREHANAGGPAGPGIFDSAQQEKPDGYVRGRIRMLEMPAELQKRVTRAVQPLVAEWAGIDGGAASLQPTSTHGTRIYYNGSTLTTHVDVVASHVLSAVYVVDRDVEEGGWPMEADPDLQGAHQVVDFGPGKLFFYEVRLQPPPPLPPLPPPPLLLLLLPSDFAFPTVLRCHRAPKCRMADRHRCVAASLLICLSTFARGHGASPTGIECTESLSTGSM